MPSKNATFAQETQTLLQQAIAMVVSDLRPLLKPERTRQELLSFMNEMDADQFLLRAKHAGHDFTTNEPDDCAFCKDVERSQIVPNLLNGNGSSHA
jgi:hypothetical protein